MVEGLSTQLTVAQAVHELQEPYRETILLRYYENLTLKEIAVRMDAPLATVGARVQRGLETLRRALERRLGANGKDWVQALLPLFVGDASLGPRATPIPLVPGWAGSRSWLSRSSPEVLDCGRCQCAEACPNANR